MYYKTATKRHKINWKLKMKRDSSTQCLRNQNSSFETVKASKRKARTASASVQWLKTWKYL